MCTIPIVDEERTTANAALHANIIKENKNIEAHFTKPRVPSTPPPIILLPGKCAKTVEFHDISSNGTASTASLRSTINHLSNNVDANTDTFSFRDLSNSAGVPASAEICFVSVYAGFKIAAQCAIGCTCCALFDMIYAES
jgi:hypothetical protein